MSEIVAAESLTPAHFSRFPVWRYMTEREADAIGDTAMCPVELLPADDLVLRVVGCKVTLADGQLVWAALSNISVWNALATEHFLTIGIFENDEVFNLERYHDFRYSEFGPEQLAKFLGKKLEAVFPIAYDLTPFSKGDPSVLKGSISAQPSRRLSWAQLSHLSAHGTID